MNFKSKFAEIQKEYNLKQSTILLLYKKAYYLINEIEIAIDQQYDVESNTKLLSEVQTFIRELTI